jgi:hypothetical protein
VSFPGFEEVKGRIKQCAQQLKRRVSQEELCNEARTDYKFSGQ